MAKKKRASKMYEEEEKQKGKLSINNLFAEKEDDDLMSINMALEKEKEEKSHTEEDQDHESHEDRLAQEIETLEQEQLEKAEVEAASKGVKVPEPQARRDPKKDKDPIEGKDLGLTENDFLLSRKVTIKDLEVHNEMNQEALLGSNVRKPKDFLSVFSRGPSSKDNPKVDTMYDIENNQVVQNHVAAKQLLHNYHSKDSTERANTLNIFLELNLDKEVLKEIKADQNAHKNKDLIETIKRLL